MAILKIKKLERENAFLVALLSLARIKFEEIQRIASWHCDFDADPENDCPDDNVAHNNGLVFQSAQAAIDAMNGGGK